MFRKLILLLSGLKGDFGVSTNATLDGSKPVFSQKLSLSMVADMKICVSKSKNVLTYFDMSSGFIDTDLKLPLSSMYGSFMIKLSLFETSSACALAIRSYRAS